MRQARKAATSSRISAGSRSSVEWKLWIVMAVWVRDCILESVYRVVGEGASDTAG